MFDVQKRTEGIAEGTLGDFGQDVEPEGDESGWGGRLWEPWASGVTDVNRDVQHDGTGCGGLKVDSWALTAGRRRKAGPRPRQEPRSSCSAVRGHWRGPVSGGLCPGGSGPSGCYVPLHGPCSAGQAAGFVGGEWALFHSSRVLWLSSSCELLQSGVCSCCPGIPNTPTPAQRLAQST